VAISIAVAAGGGAFGLASFLEDGTLDASFGGDGIAFTRFTRRGNRSRALAIQDDDRSS
jgi:hypothetical protein